MGGSPQPAPSLPSVAPGLGPKIAERVDSEIKAKNFQLAVDLVVNYAGEGMDKNYSIDTDLLKDQKMTFDASYTSNDAKTDMPSWDYINNKAGGLCLCFR
jgi:hypothetical protein